MNWRSAWPRRRAAPMPRMLLDLRRFFCRSNVAGIVWSAMLGRRCGGALAGIVAAILWAFTHIMLDLPAHASVRRWPTPC